MQALTPPETTRGSSPSHRYQSASTDASMSSKSPRKMLPRNRDGISPSAPSLRARDRSSGASRSYLSRHPKTLADEKVVVAPRRPSARRTPQDIEHVELLRLASAPRPHRRAAIHVPERPGLLEHADLDVVPRER